MLFHLNFYNTLFAFGDYKFAVSARAIMFRKLVFNSPKQVLISHNVSYITFIYYDYNLLLIMFEKLI